MYYRAVALILVLIVSAGFALQHFVRSHIESVAIAHAGDKARHMTDMLEGLPDLTSIFDGRLMHVSILEQIQEMSHDEDVLETEFYEPSGLHLPIRLDALIRDEETNHTGHTKPGAEHSVPPELAAKHSDAHSGHGGHLELLTVLQDAPAKISPKFLTGKAMLDYATIIDGSGIAHNLVTAILPVGDANDRPIGFVRYQIDVDKITNAYSSGLSWFAALLVAFGAAIFGVPVLGFLVQKRVAELSNRDAKYLASFDALTGLLNRRGFISRAEAKIEKGAVLQVAYLDADQFKSINDTYGHAIGDAYLCFVAGVIKDVFDGSALVSRLGGDEFVIATFRDEKFDVERAFEQLRLRCAKEIELQGITIRSSVSIGIAPCTADHTLEQVLKDADLALYFAKAEGGNCVSVFDQKMGIEMERRRVLEARLREAAVSNDFSIFYQPLIDAKSHKTFGYEALLRLESAEGCLISPTDFIPLAEKMGLIEDIGTWVINTATQQIAEMDSEAIVAINLSTEQFNSGRLIGIVQDALARSNLSPSRLELEITESLLLDNSTEVAMQIDTLKEMGVSVAMDDFGTGFSSLSYLWKFGFDRIKIDRSFIQALEEDPDRSLGLIESIILLGEKLGMRITAEGIETQNQSEILSALGCDVLQGFFYGHPEPLKSKSETNVDDRLKLQSS